MKKFSKILSAVLMLALLCTSLAFIVSADTPTPTITVTAKTSADAADLKAASHSPIEGNLLTTLQFGASGGSKNPNDLVDSYIVTEPGSDDSYVAFGAQKVGSGIDTQYTLNITPMPRVTNQHFYVIELDVATPTAFPSDANIQIMNRKSTNSGTEMFGESVIIPNFVESGDGKWHHITIVGQIDVVLKEDGSLDNDKTVNTVYVYVNGGYKGALANAVRNLSATQTPDSYDNGGGLHAGGIKVALSKISSSESIFFDNASRRDYSKADAEANGLAAIVAQGDAGNISDWSGYTTETRAGSSIPAVMEIDGVQYVNPVAAAEAITEGCTVTMLGDIISPFYVDVDCTIETNGNQTLISYPNGTVVTEEGSKLIVDAPYKPPITYKPSESTTDSLNVLKFPAADNRFHQIQSQYTFSVAKPDGKQFVQEYATEVDGDDNSYVSYIVTDEKTVVGSTYHTHTNFHFKGEDGQDGYILQAGTVAEDGTDTRQYVVMDWDMYTNGKMPTGMYLNITVRDQRNGSNNAGNSIYFDDLISANNIGGYIPVGEWYHMTLVCDVQSNKMYVYINNELVQTVNNGLTNTSANLTSGKGTLYGPRFNVCSATGKPDANYTPGEMFALSNYYARVLTGEEAGNLSANNGVANLSGWDKNVYTEEYVETYVPSLAPVLSVDGTVYNSALDAESDLVGNDVKEVAIISEIIGKLNIRTNAVVETNGLPFVKDVNFTVPEGATVNTEGTKVTITVPYQPSASDTLLAGTSGSLNFLASDVAGNILQGGLFQMPNNAAGGTGAGNQYLVPYKTVTTDGDEYVTLRPGEGVIGGGYTNNPYIYAENYSINNNSNKLGEKSFYVVDLDLYTESESIQNLDINVVNRNSPTGGGFPFGDGLTIGKYITAGMGWTHLTYVGDVENNVSYLFIDGELVATLGVAYRLGDGYNTPKEGLYACGIRITLPANINVKADQMLGVRDISQRVWQSNDEAGDLAAAIAAGSLANWSKNIVGYQGDAPAIVEVDGTPYSDVVSASAALNNGGEHEIVYTRPFTGTIVTNDTATITDTHGYNGKVVANVQPEKIGDMLFASNFYVDGNTFTKITEANYSTLTVSAMWAADEQWSEFETIYYPIGTQISYVGEKFALKSNYIEDGKLHNDYWYDLNAGAKVESFPTAAAGGYYMYSIASETTDTDLTVKGGLKYNMSLYANFDVNLYVPVSTGAVGSDVVTIDGAEYVRLTKQVAANSAVSEVYYEVEFVKDGVTYTELVEISVFDYVLAVLDSATISHQMKRVIMSALAYANEACKLLNGNESEEIKAILSSSAYAEYIVDDYDVEGEVNTDALAAVISGAQLKLSSEAAFVLNVAGGFEGEIKIAYKDYKGADLSLSYNVKGGEQILLNLKVYNLDSVLNITAGDVSGTYSLAGYIKGLLNAGTDAEFAQALYNYAQVAKTYKLAVNEAVKTAG